jgi:hypothetical protein
MMLSSEKAATHKWCSYSTLRSNIARAFILPNNIAQYCSAMFSVENIALKNCKIQLEILHYCWYFLEFSTKIDAVFRAFIYSVSALKLIRAIFLLAGSISLLI